MTQGEKNETRPATSATGTARSSDPDSACCWNQSAIAALLRAGLLVDAVRQVDERLPRRQPTDDAAGHPAPLVEDGEGRDGAQAEHPGEGQQRLPVGGPERRVGDPEPAHEGLRLRLAAVPDVDADELRAVTELLGSRDDRRRFRPARGAPGAPHHHDDRLAAEVLKRDRVAVEVLAGE